MQKIFKKHINIPLLPALERLYGFMSPVERFVVLALSVTIIATSLFSLYQLYNKLTVTRPGSGGSITIGMVGAPRFINPVLALSQTDRDLSEMVYAGLLTVSDTGELVPELAESYTVSDDAKEFTFKLRHELTFHDGTPLTADDVVFTVKAVSDPQIKSPLLSNWEGVTVQKIDDYTIKFILSEPYVQFLRNTTLGILPQEHWAELSPEEFNFSKLNTEPIGAGPYRFYASEHTQSGIPSSLTLRAYADYALGTPYITTITTRFYSSKDKLLTAWREGLVDIVSGLTHADMQDVDATGARIYKATLPRIFAIFLNEKHNELLEAQYVRELLRDTIDKDTITDTILSGYAQAIYGPLIANTKSTSTTPLSAHQAKEIIESHNWELGDDGIYHKNGKDFVIKLATVDNDELRDIATYLTNTWSAIGIKVKLEVFEPGDLAEHVLRNRDYDMLLFGQIVGTAPDPYAFWHSSQATDPGLNITNYKNSDIDKLLLKLRSESHHSERKKLYAQIAEIINKDVPAIFLYSPRYIMLAHNDIHGISMPVVLEPEERFSNVYKWYIHTNNILNIF